MSKSIHKDSCAKKRFSKCYEKYAQPLSTILYYKYGCLLNPSEKVRDAFFKLWKNCDNVAPEAVQSYLYTAANNMMLNAVKHQKIVFKHQDVKDTDYTNATAEFMMRKRDFLRRYELALSKLKEEERVAFLLNRIDGKTYNEIAEILNITKKVAEYRIYAALNKLKDQLKEPNLNHDETSES